MAKTKKAEDPKPEIPLFALSRSAHFANRMALQGLDLAAAKLASTRGYEVKKINALSSEEQKELDEALTEIFAYYAPQTFNSPAAPWCMALMSIASTRYQLEKKVIPDEASSTSLDAANDGTTAARQNNTSNKKRRAKPDQKKKSSSPDRA